MDSICDKISGWSRISHYEEVWSCNDMRDGYERTHSRAENLLIRDKFTALTPPSFWVGFYRTLLGASSLLNSDDIDLFWLFLGVYPLRSILSILMLSKATCCFTYSCILCSWNTTLWYSFYFCRRMSFLFRSFTIYAVICTSDSLESMRRSLRKNKFYLRNSSKACWSSSLFSLSRALLGINIPYIELWEWRISIYLFAFWSSAKTLFWFSFTESTVSFSSSTLTGFISSSIRWKSYPILRLSSTILILFTYIFIYLPKPSYFVYFSTTLPQQLASQNQLVHTFSLFHIHPQSYD